MNLLITQVYGHGFTCERIMRPHIKFYCYLGSHNLLAEYVSKYTFTSMFLDFDRWFLFEIYIATERIVIFMVIS